MKLGGLEGLRFYPVAMGRYTRFLAMITRELSFRDPMDVTEIVYYRKNKASFAKCPRCMSPLDREYVSFCDRCGQRLSWNAQVRVVIRLK